MFTTIWSVVKAQFRQPYFPFLLAWFSVLGYYLHNLAEVELSMLWQPLALVTVIVGLAMWGWWWLLRDWAKAGMVAGVIALAVFNYSQLTSWYPFDHVKLAGVTLTSQKVLIPLSFLLIVAMTWWLRRSSRSLVKLVAVVNVLAVILIAQLMYSVAVSQLNRGVWADQTIAERRPEVTVSTATSKLGYNPDVYYIILDRYPNQFTLSEMYGADNDQFRQALIDKGFYIADKAAANYPYTPLSLSSSLNMQYHAAVPADVQPYPQVVTRIYPELQDTVTNQLFHQLGYKTYQMGSWFTPTHYNEAVDGNFVATNFWHTQVFTNQYLSGTMLAPLARAANIESAASLNYDQLHLRNYEYQVAEFASVAALPGPKFVFVHMLMPHPPYVVDSHCQPGEQKGSDLDKFLAQTECANLTATQMVDAILKVSKQKPIIVLQSDEGPYTLVNKMPDSVEFAGASDASVLERSRILSSYYLPDGDTSQLYDTISPVNSFRTIFRQYFDADTPNLNDQTFVPPSRPKLFDFIDKTDVIRRWQAQESL